MLRIAVRTNFLNIPVVTRSCSTNNDCNKKTSSTKREFKSQNWTKERQDAVVENLKKQLETKWKTTEEVGGEAPEDISIDNKTGEIGGPKGPEPTR